jgi:hypothetical protein
MTIERQSMIILRDGFQFHWSAGDDVHRDNDVVVMVFDQNVLPRT